MKIKPSFRVGVGVAALLAAVSATQAAAASDLSKLTKTWGTSHVLVHYTDAAKDPDAVSLTDAKRLAVTAERTYAVETAWGFASPVDGTLGGDSRLDLFVAKTSDGRSRAVPSVVPGFGRVSFVQLDPSAVRGRQPAARYAGTIAHEIFHAIQLTYAAEAPFLTEATAEWAALHASPQRYRPSLPLLATKPEASLDCPGAVCGEKGNAGRGYGQWPFFEFLSQRYGKRVIRDIFVSAGELQALDGGSHALEAIDRALQLRSTTLSATWSAYAAANLAPRGYRNRLLRELADWRKPSELIRLGARPARLPGHGLEVDHLAMTHVDVVTPGCTFSRSAQRTTLHVRVAIPEGVPSAPSFRLTRGAGAPVVKRLRVSNGVASLDVPRWGGCATGRLALPNASWTVDGAHFVVRLSTS